MKNQAMQLFQEGMEKTEQVLNTGKDPEAIRDYAACISGIVDFFETNDMVTIDMLDFEEPFKQSLRADKRMIETIMKMEIEKIKLITTFVILLLLSIYRFEKSQCRACISLKFTLKVFALELSSPLKKWQARLTQCWENRKEMIEESAKILCPISGRQSRPIKKSKGVRLCLWAFYWF